MTIKRIKEGCREDKILIAVDTVVDIRIADFDAEGNVELLLNATGGPDLFYTGVSLKLIELDGVRPVSETTVYENGSDDWITWLRISDINSDGLPDISNDDKGKAFTLMNKGALEFE